MTLTTYIVDVVYSTATVYTRACAGNVEDTRARMPRKPRAGRGEYQGLNLAQGRSQMTEADVFDQAARLLRSIAHLLEGETLTSDDRFMLVNALREIANCVDPRHRNHGLPPLRLNW